MTKRLEALLQFLAQDPDDTFTRYAIALEYIASEEYDEAIKFLESVLTLDNNYLAAYQQLGHIYAITNRKDMAVDVYKRGIDSANISGDKHAADNISKFLAELQ
jgi:tetratricopeptide (TPR) repeat protein